MSKMLRQSWSPCCSRIRENSDAGLGGYEVSRDACESVRLRRNSYEIPLQTGRSAQLADGTGEGVKEVEDGKDARGILMELERRGEVVVCGIGVGRANFTIGHVPWRLIERRWPANSEIGTPDPCLLCHLAIEDVKEVEGGKDVEDARVFSSEVFRDVWESVRLRRNSYEIPLLRRRAGMPILRVNDAVTNHK